MMMKASKVIEGFSCEELGKKFHKAVMSTKKATNNQKEHEFTRFFVTLNALSRVDEFQDFIDVGGVSYEIAHYGVLPCLAKLVLPQGIYLSGHRRSEYDMLVRPSDPTDQIDQSKPFSPSQFHRFQAELASSFRINTTNNFDKSGALFGYLTLSEALVKATKLRAVKSGDTTSYEGVLEHVDRIPIIINGMDEWYDASKLFGFSPLGDLLDEVFTNICSSLRNM